MARGARQGSTDAPWLEISQGMPARSFSATRGSTTPRGPDFSRRQSRPWWYAIDGEAFVSDISSEINANADRARTAVLISAVPIPSNATPPARRH